MMERYKLKYRVVVLSLSRVIMGLCICMGKQNRHSKLKIDAIEFLSNLMSKKECMHGMVE